MIPLCPSITKEYMLNVWGISACDYHLYAIAHIILIMANYTIPKPIILV